jgi:thiol-disulfide isomerase/thioredoxin
MKRQILNGVVVLSALLLISAGNKPVDDFVIFNVHGKRHTFYELVRQVPHGGLLIVNFTSVNCKPCKKEIPELLAIKKSSEKLHLLFIYAECCQPVKDHASTFGILDMAFVDPFGKVRGIFEVKSFPVTFIINRNRTVVGRYDGYTTENIESIRDAVQ